MVFKENSFIEKENILSFKEAFTKHQINEEDKPVKFLLEGQYAKAYEILTDAYNAGLYVGIIGPVGSGKTALCRQFAYDQKIGFSWITFSDLIRPATLIGTFDPTLVFKLGYSLDSFIPGPFTLASIYGHIFFANEVNRGEEFVLNTLLDAMEEGRLYIPQLKTWLKVDPKFFFIAAMNPSELRGTRVLPQAFKDRIRVWIQLDYPDKETEKKIVKVNCPELDIPNDILNKIIDIISETRNMEEITKPASIRTAIAYAKLLITRSRRLNKDPNSKMMAEIGKMILLEGLEYAPGIEKESLVDRLLHKHLDY